MKRKRLPPGIEYLSIVTVKKKNPPYLNLPSVENQEKRNIHYLVILLEILILGQYSLKDINIQCTIIFGHPSSKPTKY